MTTKLLETTFLIYYWGGHESTAAYLTTHENTAEFCTSTLNRAELATGLAATDRLDPAVVDERFSWVRAVPFRTEHAQEAGRIEAELRANEEVEQRQIAELKTDIYR